MNTPVSYWPVRHLHISNNAPYCPPPPPPKKKKLYKPHSFQFLLGRLEYPGEMKNKRYAKFLGVGGQIRCIMRDVQVANSLRSNDATVTTTSPENWICVLSVFIAMIRTYFFKCTRTLLNLNSKGRCSSSESKIKQLNKFSSLLVYVLHKTCTPYLCKNGKEMYKKRDARAKLLFFLLNLFLFTGSRCRRVIES